MEILQSNMSWDAIKQFLYVYGPPVDYTDLKTNLQYIGEADAYLKTIHHPTFTPFNHPHPIAPPTPAHQLPQGTLMEVDHTQHSGTSTHPQAMFHSSCYNCGQAGHPAQNCPTSCLHRKVHIAPPPQDEVSH